MKYPDDYLDQVLQGDCLEIMPTIPDASMDAIIADIPYGTTACKWDTVIPFAPMWAQLKRIAKPKAAIVLFGSQPFTSALVMSNAKMFRYEWVWDKHNPTGFLNVKQMPMKQHENVLVFSINGHKYNPQKELRNPSDVRRFGKGEHAVKINPNGVYGSAIHNGSQNERGVLRFPKSIIFLPSGNPWTHRKYDHPTQKPVALLEYLIRTYTNEGDAVLDFTAGSGTTGVAAKNTNRHFILIEKEADYCAIARKRLDAVQPPLVLA